MRTRLWRFGVRVRGWRERRGQPRYVLELNEGQPWIYPAPNLLGTVRPMRGMPESNALMEAWIAATQEYGGAS